MSNIPKVVEVAKCTKWHEVGRFWAFKCDNPQQLFLRVGKTHISPHKMARYISLASIIGGVYFSMSGFGLHAMAIILVGVLVNNLLINQLAALLEKGMETVNSQRDAMLPEILVSNALAPIIWEMGKQFDPEGPEVDWKRVYALVQLTKMVLAEYPMATSIRKKTEEAIDAITSKTQTNGFEDDELFRHIQYDLWQLHKTLDDNESEFIND